MIGWKLLDCGLEHGIPLLPWCAGDVDNGFSSTSCSLRHRDLDHLETKRESGTSLDGLAS